MKQHREVGWPTLEEPTLVAPPPPPPPLPPPSRVGAGMVLALTALALAVTGLAVAYFLTHRNVRTAPTTVVVATTPGTDAAGTPGAARATRSIAVPHVAGLTERGALARLAQVGLNVKIVMRPSRGTGRVVSQKPSAGRELEPGRTVTVVVDGQAGRQIAAPSLIGQSIGDARQKLRALGLHVVSTGVSSKEPAGTVVDQAPKPGSKLRKGWNVILSVARPSTTTQGGTTSATTNAVTTTAASTTAPPTTAATTAPPPQPTSATMPDISGQKEQAAVSSMNRAGILASLFFVPSDDPLGTVEEQAKPAGATLPYHSHVQINISSGPGQKPQVQVPNVIGRTLRDAVGVLNGAQLRLIYVKFAVASGRVGVVVQQSPLAGAHAPTNAQVLVFLAVKR